MTHYPAAPPAAGTLLVLAHGAGAGQRHPFMLSYARAVAARGVDVITFDFPYMTEKRRVPDKAPVLEEAFRRVVAEAREAHRPGRLFIGGKSMGGRIATHLATEDALGLNGVVSLGYPLHPPGKPLQKRIAHFGEIRVPWLIVQGERDAFGTPSELQADLPAVAAAVQLHVVAGGDHSLVVKGRSADEVRDEVVTAILGFIRRAAGRESS